MKYKYEIKITAERPDYSEEVIYNTVTNDESTLDILLRHGAKKVQLDKLEQIGEHDCQLSFDKGCESCQKLISF